MLTRAEIDERLATWALDHSQREALETAKRLYQERDEARVTIKRLNRRCTKAEAAAMVTVEDCKRQGVSFGRSLANWYAMKLAAEKDAWLRGEGE